MKKMLALVLALVMVLGLAACAAAKPAEATPAAAKPAEATPAAATPAEAKIEPVTIRLTSIWANDDRTKIIQEHFVDVVNAKCEGNVTVEYYQGDTLVASNSVVEYIVNGLVDAAVADSAVWNVYTHDVDILNSNFFDNSAHCQRFLQGPFGDRLAETLSEETEVKILAWLHSGDVDIIGNSNRPLDTPDYSGLKLRAANASDAAICTALGGTPITIDAAELYTALQRDTVDGFTMTVVSTVLANQLYEECPYFTRLLMKSGMRNPLVIRNEIWDQLASEYQEIIQTAATETEDVLFSFQQSSVDNYWAELEKLDGVEIHVIEGDEFDVWHTAMEPAYVDVLKDISADDMAQFKTWINDCK